MPNSAKNAKKPSYKRLRFMISTVWIVVGIGLLIAVAGSHPEMEPILTVLVRIMSFGTFVLLGVFVFLYYKERKQP